jgi:two-component system response regulator HydG
VGRILIVEDNATLREAMAEVLRAEHHLVRQAASAEEALAQIEGKPPELLLTDLRLPGKSGLELLRDLKGQDPFAEVIVITAYGTVEGAVEAMRAGAFDFLTKPVRLDHLVAKARQALLVRGDRLSLQRERERREYAEEEIREVFNEGQIIGRSSAMQEIYDTIEKVAASNSSVLITGESGTGKELVARAIHMRSQRRGGPFVRVNCGALAPGLLESELFGHEKGAFTGAVRQRRGRFELADGGVLFLDEIADVGTSLQVKLLRVLQEREFERVGGEQSLRVDVRMIAATHQDLAAAVKKGSFREDLFYRLYVIPIHLPPLRERSEDIPLLAEHFVGRLCEAMQRPPVSLDDEAVALLRRYGWPGNVRELENALERAIVLCEADRLTAADLAFLGTRGGEAIALPAGIPPLPEALEQLERALIERAMDRAGGVKSEAARLLGIKPSALYYKLEKYGLS